MTATVNGPALSLTQAEAEARFAQLSVTSYDVRLDLDQGPDSFDSLTTIEFTSAGGATFVDLKPIEVHSLTFNGAALDPDTLERGRLPLETVAGANTLTVHAQMPFRNDGEGLHRSTDPADGRDYVYGMCFMEAAPTVFACFDQPDLKAPITLTVRAPLDWSVFANGRGHQREPGLWEFETTPPLSTYFVTLVAGPWHVVHDEHDGIALSLSCRASLAEHLDAEELFTITKQCFDEFHRLFGVRYAFGDYHQAFVPEFNAGAMENPGCVTYRDQMVFESKPVRGQRIMRATTMAHEMAHQWFGNIVTPKWWDDLWLNESFAEYMGTRVTAAATAYDDAWLHNTYIRRQWGLTADQRPSTHPVAGNGAKDAASALMDFDGISYAKGSSILRQLNARMGDEVFFAGVRDHFEQHRFGNATMHDLFESWERAGAQDLKAFTEPWLRTAGPDRLSWDPETSELVRTPPADHPAVRQHTVRLVAGPDWDASEVSLAVDRTPVAVAGSRVLIDPWLDTWSVNLIDEPTLVDLATSLPGIEDRDVRAGAWNNIRSTYHLGFADPDQVAAVAVAALPVETAESAHTTVGAWTLARVIPLTREPDAWLDRAQVRFAAAAASAEPGSSLQLAITQLAIASARDEALLRRWLAGDGVPEGVVLDSALRWAIWLRLAGIGAADVAELDAALAEEPSTKARVEHARAMAARPTTEAKEWAWQRLVGEVKASNYELEAAGLGLWRWGQRSLTDPFIERYFEALETLPQVHQGWVLGTAAQSFFPITALDPAVVTRAEALAESGSLDPAVRRSLIDCTDDLRRLQEVRDRYGSQ